MVTTKAQSLKRRWNMPSVGDKSPVILFPSKKKKEKKKNSKNPKPLLNWIYSPPFPPLLPALPWAQVPELAPALPSRLPPLHLHPFNSQPLRLLLQITKTRKLEK
jgi:hypothetical protein